MQTTTAAPIKRPMRPEYLYLDQHGAAIFARTMKELQAKAKGGTVRHYYRNSVDGRPLQVGYVVANAGQPRYFTRYQQVEFPAS
jgi:hypothetical protein